MILNLLSCLPRNEPKIFIENKANITLDSIKIFTSSSLPTVFYLIKNNEKVKGKVLFDKKNKGDGCYEIEVFQKDILINYQCFGYYTNGSSLNREFRMTIKKDTIIINSK